MASILRTTFSALAFMLLIGVPQAQVQVSEQCDPPAKFKLEEPLILGNIHREALRLLGEIPGQPEGTKAQQNEFGRQFAAHVTQVAQRGTKQATLGVLFWSLGELMARSGTPDIQKMGHDFRTQSIQILLQHATSRQEIDQLAYFAFNRDMRGITDLSRPKVDAAAWRIILNKHIQAFGANRRQMELWDRLRGVGPENARESLFSEQISAADRTGDQRTRFDARMAYFDWLQKEKPDSDAIENILDEIHEEASIRISKNIEKILSINKNDDLSCAYIDQGAANNLASEVLDSEYAGKYEDLRRVAIRVLPISIGYGTDPGGMLANASKFLASRFIDRRAQSEGFSYIVESACPQPIGSTARAICSAAEMAAAAASITAHSTARVALDDVLVLVEKNDPLAISASIDALAAAATFHWQRGDASKVQDWIERAEQLAQKPNARPTPIAMITLKLLRAEIANAEMNFDEAIRLFKELVDTAETLLRDEIIRKNGSSSNTNVSLDVNSKERMRISKFWIEESSDVNRLKSLLFLIFEIDSIVEKTLRRSFCSGCGDAALQIASRWISLSKIKTSALDYSGGAKDFLRSLRLPSNFLSQSDREEIFSGLKSSLKAVSGARASYELAVSNLRRESSRRYAEREEARQVALYQTVFGDIDIKKCRLQLFSMRQSDNLGAMIRNNNCFNKSNFSEMNLEAQNWFNITGIDDLARILRYAGYGWPSRELFREVVTYTNGDNGPPKFGEVLENEIAESRTLVPAHARLAAFAEEAKDWPLLNQHLDRARLIALKRLEREWDVGNDRAGILLREFRASIRLIAQLRLRAAANPSAKAYQSKLLASGLEDLQLAMLGDTALTALASQKRRITNDPRLKDLIDERGRLRGEIGALDALKWAVDNLDARIYGREKDKLSPRLAEVEAEIKRLLPVPEDLTTPNPTPLPELQRYLQPREGVLILHAGSDGLYGMLVGKSGEPKSWVSKIALKDLEARIATVRQGIEITGNRLPLFKFAESAELLELLLGPAKEEAFALDSLNVVADGPLQSLPLGILPMRKPATEPMTADEFRSSGTQWFALGPVLRHLTSVKALHARERTSLATKSEKPFFGIGNPKLKGVATGIAMAGVPRSLTKSVVTDLEALRNLAALPDTEVQLAAMAQTMGAEHSTLMLGDAANERAIKASKLDQYRVITFATHGLVAGEFQGLAEPGLVLTPPQVASAEDDGVLTSSEISQLKFDADLVILSACNTAASDGRPGAEGLSGLARAFMGAGARSLVVSHWAIPSGPTVDIMKALVASKEQGRATDWAKALRTATKAAIETLGPPEMAHPANWGAFVVYGQN